MKLTPCYICYAPCENDSEFEVVVCDECFQKSMEEPEPTSGFQVMCSWCFAPVAITNIPTLGFSFCCPEHEAAFNEEEDDESPDR